MERADCDLSSPQKQEELENDGHQEQEEWSQPPVEPRSHGERHVARPEVNRLPDEQSGARSIYPRVCGGHRQKGYLGGKNQPQTVQCGAVGKDRGSLTPAETDSGGLNTGIHLKKEKESLQTLVVTRTGTYGPPTEALEESLPPETEREEPLRKSRATRPKAKLWLHPTPVGGTTSEVVPPQPNAAFPENQQPPSVQAVDPPEEVGGEGTTFEEVGPDELLYPLPAVQRIALSVKAAQWPTAKRHGIVADGNGRIVGFDPSVGFPPHAEVIVEVLYPLCMEEGIYFYKHPDSSAIFTYGVTSQGILPPKYFLNAVERATGTQLYPDVKRHNAPEGYSGNPPERVQPDEGVDLQIDGTEWRENLDDLARPSERAVQNPPPRASLARAPPLKPAPQPEQVGKARAALGPWGSRLTGAGRPAPQLHPARDPREGYPGEVPLQKTVGPPKNRGPQNSQGKGEGTTSEDGQSQDWSQRTPTSDRPFPMFRFQTDLPPEERLAYQRLREGLGKRPSRPNIYQPQNRDEASSSWQALGDREIYSTQPPPSHVLDEDWGDSYNRSVSFGSSWRATRGIYSDTDSSQSEFPSWPAGVKIQFGKMYWAGKLCIPEDKCLPVVDAYHRLWGHIGVKRMVQEIGRKCEFPTGVGIEKTVEAVKRGCQVCQQTEPPNWQVARKQNMTPIPAKVFTSVCIDIFSMPEEFWQGVRYDCIIVCVDRLSGWIIAKPTQKMGLTAEKAAHLMLDDGWNIYGVPQIVTSDQGPQFAGAWWKTMCKRLGIRQAFSQAHRPQSNGRAEMAGKQLITILRKLNAEQKINWVEALPQALRLHHDNPGPTGWSPYEIVFGRERSLPDIPQPIETDHEDAEAFFDRMGKMDKDIAAAMNALHSTQQGWINSQRKTGQQYKIGDQVWVQRPKQVGGHKIQPWWAGPYPIVGQEGEQSFVVRWGSEGLLPVHADQLKPWVGEALATQGIPMCYRHSDPVGQLPLRIATIRDHRQTQWGYEFLVHWEGTPLPRTRGSQAPPLFIYAAPSGRLIVKHTACPCCCSRERWMAGRSGTERWAGSSKLLYFFQNYSKWVLSGLAWFIHASPTLWGGCTART